MQGEFISPEYLARITNNYYKYSWRIKLRIKKIIALEILPVKNFQVDNLSDLVVIAGPNGVGKTRLILSLLNNFQNLNESNISFEIEATNRNEEEIFGKKIIDTSISEDAGKLTSLLQIINRVEI